jgi:hypothetical protein
MERNMFLRDYQLCFRRRINCKRKFRSKRSDERLTSSGGLRKRFLRRIKRLLKCCRCRITRSDTWDKNKIRMNH